MENMSNMSWTTWWCERPLYTRNVYSFKFNNHRNQGGRDLQGKRKLGILLDREMEEDDESENMPILLPHGINQEVYPN